jgi:hypothetical protein
VEVSNGAIIMCSHESCVEVVNKSNLQSKTPSRFILTRDNKIRLSIKQSQLNHLVELGAKKRNIFSNIMYVVGKTKCKTERITGKRLIFPSV